jgi:DNA-binding NarL/FixJ family response regulator
LKQVKIKIGIVDDTQEILKNLESHFSNHPDFEITIVAHNGKDFIAQCKKYKTEFLPDIVLMDIDMPNLSGLETIKQTRLFNQSIKFIMFTVFDDDTKIFEAIKNGANGYLLKESSLTKIEESLKEMQVYGAVPMSPSVARKALKMLSNSTLINVEEKEDDLSKLLSNREIGILKLIILGKRYKEIADETNISQNTVRNHVTTIYRKLQVSSNVEAAQLVTSRKWF